MAPCQEANDDYLGNLFDLLCNNCMLSVNIRTTLMRQFQCVNTTYNFMIKYENFP